MARRKKSRKTANQSRFGAASRACMASRPGSWKAFGQCMKSRLKSRRIYWGK
jgi:hypothetical protein